MVELIVRICVRKFCAYARFLFVVLVVCWCVLVRAAFVCCVGGVLVRAAFVCCVGGVCCVLCVLICLTPVC